MTPELLAALVPVAVGWTEKGEKVYEQWTSLTYEGCECVAPTREQAADMLRQHFPTFRDDAGGSGEDSGNHTGRSGDGREVGTAKVAAGTLWEW